MDLTTDTPNPYPSADGGPQGGTTPGRAQLDRAALAAMTPEEIAAALDAGQLDEIRGITPTHPHRW